METPTSTGTVTQPEPLKPWKQVAEESNIFSLPPEQRLAEYDKWSSRVVEQGIRNGDFDSRETFNQFKLKDIRTRKNLVSDDIIGPSDDEVVADYEAFKGAFASTQAAFAADKPTPQDEAIQGEVLQGKRNAAFVRGQMVFNPAVVNDPQKYREAILESDAPADIKMFYAGLRPEMEKSATVTRRRELASNVITRDVADKVVTAIQEGTELFGMDIGTPQSPALTKNKDGVWSVVDPEYVDQSASMLDIANARYNPLGDSQYKPLPAINEYQKKYGLTDEQVQQDYMESLIENAPTTVNRWLGKATSIEDYVKQLDSTVRVKNKDVAPEVRVQDPNLFFDEQGYNAAVDKASAPDEAKNLAKAARAQFADAVAGDIYNNLLNNRDDFRENYAKDVVSRGDMEKAITRYYKDKKDQAWYDDVGETFGQAGTALSQGGMNLVMMPSAILGMFGSVKDAEDVRIATMVQNGEMQAEEAVANRTGGAGFIKLNNDVMRIIPDLVVQMGIAVAAGGTLSGAQASLVAARTGISRAAATTALRQAAITGEKAALKSQLLRIIPEVTANTVDDVAEEVLKASARTMSNNPFKGGIGTQRAVGSAYAGLTSAASTFGQVYTDVVKMGKSPEEAIATARTAGVVAGAITSGLTHSFGMLGRGGVEDFASMGRKAGEFTIKDIVNAGLLDSLTTQEGRQLMRNIAKGISKDALSEGAEEGLDQALNLISQYATNPSPEAQNRKVTDIINESLYASLLGGIAGGGAASVGQARATAPGVTAQQMQAEIIGAQEPIAPDVAPPTPAAPATPAVQPSADPAVQEAQATVENLAEIPDTTQTAAALAALANAAAVPKPEFNLPEIDVPAEPAPEAQPEEEIVTPIVTPKEWAKSLPDAQEGTGTPNETSAPQTGSFKEGQITADKYGDDPYIYRDEWINVADYDPRVSEDFVGLEGLPYETVAKMETTQRYAEWYREGSFGPPITIVQNQVSGRGKSNNRRRIVAAIEAGVDRIPARVEIGRASEIMPSGKFANPAIPPTPEAEAPVNAEETPVEPAPTVAKVELEPTENMKTEEIDNGLAPAKLPKDATKIASSPTREGVEKQITKFYAGEKKNLVPVGNGVFAVESPSGKRLSTRVIQTPKGFYFVEGAADQAEAKAEAVTEDSAPYDLQIMSATTAEWRTVETFASKQEAEKGLPKGSGWRIQPSEKPVKQPQPTKPDAVQKPKPDAGVLRQEGQEVGLPKVDQGGRSAEQEGAGQEGEVKAELTRNQEEVVVFIEQETDDTEKVIVAAEKKPRITPGKARKVGIAKQIERLGINSNDPDSVIAALEKIANNPKPKPSEKHHIRIAKDLLSVLKGSGVQIQLISGNDAKLSEGDSSVNGWYDPKTNTAYINLDGPHELGIEETILHELVHASGEKVIQNPQTEAQKRILGDLEKQMLAARKNAIALGQAKMGVDVTDLNMLIDMAASQNDYGLFDILYGVSSLSEYHAHATTSRSFQKFLATYKEGGKRLLFERFVNSITRMLSGVKTAENSDAEKAYATLLDLMREGKGDVRKSNTNTIASEQAVSVTDVVTEPIPKSETKKLDALPDDATIEDISQASPKLIEQSKALAIKFKDFASWSTAATKAFGSKAARFLKTIWTGLKSISIAAIIGYTVTGVDSAFAPSIQEVGKLAQEDAVSASYILPETPPQQELVAVSISEPAQRPTEIAKPPTQKSKTTDDKITESLSAFDSSVSHYVDFADTEFELEILNSVEPTAAMKAVAPLIGEMEGNRLSGPNKTLEKVFEVGGIRASQDEIPWCAMFISHGLNKAGTPTKNVMASQFLSFGKKTSTPKTGDVVVFNKRNDDNTISPNIAGHVGFFIRESGDFVLVLNGNVGDGVAVTALPKRRVMQYRSAPAARTDTVQSRARGVSSEMDAEYLELAKDPEKNVDALRAMVNAAAKAAGLKKGYFHATDSGRADASDDFTEFRTGEVDVPLYNGGRIKAFKPAWFTNSKDYLRSIGRSSKVREFFLDIKNPLDLTFLGESPTPSELDKAYRNAGLIDVSQAHADKGNLDEGFVVMYDEPKGNDLARKLITAGYDAMIISEAGGAISTVVWSPSQIKSADPVTRDDSGNVIPLSQRFQPASPDIRYSRARGTEQDSAFVELERRFKAGDKSAEEEARKLIEKIAKEQGWTERAYHGTPGGGFTVFDIYGSRYGLMGQGAYFTNAKDVAQSYADNKGRKVDSGSQTPQVYEVLLKPGRVLDMEAPVDKQFWLNAFGDYLTEDSLSEAKTNEDAFRAMEEGLAYEGLSMSEGAEIVTDGLMSSFDSVTHIGGKRMGKGENLHNVTIVFSSEQIKSADPFTYDDNGNLILPSERFQPESPDIRYSRARGIISDTVTKYAPEFNVADDKDGPSVFFDGRNVTVNPSKLEGLDEYEVRDLAERAVVAAKAAPKDPIAAGIIQQTDMYDPYNFDSVSRKEIRKSLAKAHAVATENGMAPLAMDLGVKLFEYGGATDAEVRKSMARGTASDEEYLAAVEAGDMERVQQMVDAAARAAGYNVGPVSHATDTKFNEFRPTLKGRFGRGMYFSDKYLSYRGKINMRAYLKNPQVTEIKSPWKRDSPKWTPETHNEYFVTDPSQIKSADPVTRDDAGNIIPLSQRFQSESPDIRYSKARGTELVTYIPRTYSAPRLLFNKLIAGFRSRGMVTEAAYEKFRDSEGFKKANASFISFIAKDYAKVANKYFGEGEESWLDFRVFSRDATGEVTVSKKGFKTPQEAESFAKVSGSKDYIVTTGQDLMNKALGSNSHTLKEDVRDKIEKLTKKGLDDIANSIKAYKEEYLNYWNLVMMQPQPGMIDPDQIATLKERKQQWMKALELREAEQRKIVDDARKEAVRAALADGTNRIIAQQEFAKAYLPDDLVYQIGRAREKIDELSNRLREIKWLMDGSELEMIIGERLEVYVTRSYEAFETKDRVGYVNWLNEAYQALYQPGKAYDPLAMDRIMPLVRHIKETIVQRRIEDLVRENEQNQIDDIMAELIADPRQITQVDRIPGQPIEGTEYEQLVRAVAKKELETRRSQEKKDFIERAITSLGRNGFASNIGDARKRKVALRKEANRLYEQRYPEQTAVSAIMGAPNPLRWAMMTETEAHDIANVERSLSESPGNVNGSRIWTSSINGLKHASFHAAVSDDFQKNLDFITGAPASKTGLTGATANDWKRLGDKILEHKNDVPAFLRTFLGEKDNPLLRVSDTILKQSHLVAVGELYQNLAEVGMKEGWLIDAELKPTDSKYSNWKPILNSENTDQGYGSNPFKGLYADPVMIGAINTLLAANQPSNTATKVISRIVGLSLWAVTAGSVKAIVRNLSSLGAFLLNSGILSAVLVPSRTIPVLKNVVLAARIMNESMTAVGKVSGGKKIEGKAFQLADKFWTGALAAIAVQRPATAVIKGASSFAQFASRMKENPSSEQAQEMYQLAVKLGVANDNVQKESIQRLLDIEETISRKPVDRNLGKFAKALKLDGIVGFGSYLLGTIKTAGQQRSQLYGAPDDFTKILAWLNEMDTQARIHSKDKAEYNKWRGKDGLFTDMPEEHVRRAANYTTDLVQSHSKVWAHITQFKKMGFGTFIAPFIAARAEFYRNMANAYRISFAEMRSDIPIEKANGRMRFASALMAHLAYGTMASAVLKMIFRAFADDEEVVEDSQEIRDAIRRLGPEYAKNKSAASVLYKNGTFDWIDISFSNPFAFVWESIYAGRRAASDADVDDFVPWLIARDIIGENLGNFVSPQIAVGAGATVISGFDPVRGIKIWDSQADTTAEKVKKATLYYLKQAGLPGDWKSAMNIYNAAKGVEENGRKYKVGTEVAGVFLGASVRTIKVTDMVEQKLSQAKDNLNARVGPLYNAQLRDSNDVDMEDVVDAAEKYHKTGQDAIKRMQRVWRAGEVLLSDTLNGQKMLRGTLDSDKVKMSREVERAIVTGKNLPSTVSPQTMQKIEALGKKHDDERVKVTKDTLKRLNQKP